MAHPADNNRRFAGSARGTRAGLSVSPPDPAALARALSEPGERPLAELLAEVDRLFATHQDLIYAICLRSTGDPQLAAELAQESLMRAYEKLPTFRGESRFRTWLIGIARYECLNALRKRQDRLAEDGVIDPTDQARPVLSGLHRLERDELVRAASQAVLDPTEQEVIHLRYVEQLPIQEIDRLLSLPQASGARAVLQRCQRKLQREIRRRLAAMGHASSFVRGSMP